jgi:hypothetical protein
MRVPVHCQLVLLVKIDSRDGKTFGSGEGREKDEK